MKILPRVTLGRIGIPIFSVQSLRTHGILGRPMKLFNKTFYKFLFSFGAVITITLALILLVNLQAM